MKDAAMDHFFKGLGADKKPKQESTKDAPNFALFILQVINRYGSMASKDSMVWSKIYRSKETGKRYTVTITLEEKP